MIKRILLFFLISLRLPTVFGQNIFEKISSKTWLEENGFAGVAVVFVKTDKDQLKVFRQTNGSGVPVVATEVFDVEIRQDSIFLLKNKKQQQESNTERLIYIYSDKQGLLRNGQPLRITLNEPLIYLFTENKQGIGKSINTHTITKYELDKNIVYVNEKPFIINSKDRPDGKDTDNH
jgi:hypothetical protein